MQTSQGAIGLRVVVAKPASGPLASMVPMPEITRPAPAVIMNVPSAPPPNAVTTMPPTIKATPATVSIMPLDIRIYDLRYYYKFRLLIFLLEMRGFRCAMPGRLG